jgi:hypothetical protein
MSFILPIALAIATVFSSPPDSCRLKVDAEGLPWSPKGVTESHLLEIAPGAVRLVSEKTGEGIIVHLEKGLAFVLNPRVGQYEEQPLTDLSLDKERAKSRERKLEKILGADVSDEVKDKWLAREGLRRDGKTVVTVEETEKARLIAGRTCTLTKIVENGKDRVLLWLDTGLPRPSGFDRFLSESGLLPSAMAGEIAALTGFPLGMEINLDYKVADIRVEIHATSHDVAEIPPESFRVPEGLVARKDAERDDDEDTCATCGKALDGNRSISLFHIGGFTRYYCSGACREVGREKLRKKLEED